MCVLPICATEKTMHAELHIDAKGFCSSTALPQQCGRNPDHLSRVNLSKQNRIVISSDRYEWHHCEQTHQSKQQQIDNGNIGVLTNQLSWKGSGWLESKEDVWRFSQSTQWIWIQIQFLLCFLISSWQWSNSHPAAESGWSRLCFPTPDILISGLISLGLLVRSM